MTSRSARRQTIVPLGDTLDEEYDEERASRRRKRQGRQQPPAMRMRGVSGPTVTYSLVWNKQLMNSARYAASLFSVVALVLVAWFIFFWIIGWLPSFPTTLANYAVVFFFFFVPVYIIGAAMWVSMAIEFYALSLVLQVMALATETYVLVALLYKWVVCVDGTAPPECVNSYYMDTIVTALLFALWVSALIATCAHVVVIFRGSPAQSVSKLYEPQ